MAILTAALEKRSSAARWLPWLVSLSGGLLFFYEFIQLNIINSISVQLMSEFHINAAQLGKLSSTYFYANISCLFLAGNLLDRFSTRRLILLALILCTAGTFCFALAPTVLIAGIGRTFIGFGGAFCLISAVRLASRWFSPRRMALLTGLIVTMAFIGGWVAQTPATWLVSLMGWRNMMLVDGVLGLFIIAWIFVVIQDRPAQQKEKALMENLLLKQLGVWKSINLILRNRQNWYAGIYTCLLNLPIFLLGAMWGKMYLEQVNHLSAVQASSICGMLFLGSIFGSPVMGLISDMMGLRRLPMLICAVLSFILIMIILYVPNLSFAVLHVLFFLLGLITCSQVISYPLVTEHNRSILTGTAVSIVSMTCLLGGALGFPFSGWLLDLGWDHTMMNGSPVYSAADFHHAMLIMPIAFVIGFVIALFVKETHCKPQYDDATGEDPAIKKSDTFNQGVLT